MIVHVGNLKAYAARLDSGGRLVPIASPFLKSAFEAVREELADKLGDVVERAILGITPEEITRAKRRWPCNWREKLGLSKR